MSGTVGVGVIGLGFMGWRHIAAYRAARDAGFACELRAVCDSDPARWEAGAAAGNLGDGAAALTESERRAVRVYGDVDEMLHDPAVQLVSVCTYTDSHVDLALRAMAAGKHVLVEKPIALEAAEVRRLADAAAKASTLCMPAMCMRFWPGWEWLHDRVKDGSLGRVRSATFTRLGSPPGWASGFYSDFSRSGGALVDLHIHDTDFVVWCFGRPRSVASTGSLAHVTTLYRYGADGPALVSAEGGWSLSPSAGFRMRYVVCFDEGTAEFDLSKSPVLTLHTAEGSRGIEVPLGTGYDGEVRHIVGVIASGGRALRATMEDAAVVAEVLESERRGVTGER